MSDWSWRGWKSSGRHQSWQTTKCSAEPIREERGLKTWTVRKRVLSWAQSTVVSGPPEYLGDERAPPAEHVARHRDAGEDELVLHVLIQVVHARHVRGAVRDDEVRAASLEAAHDLACRRRARDVALDEVHALHGRHGLQVHGHQSRDFLRRKALVARRKVEPAAEDLSPRPRRGAQVHHVPGALEDAERIINLDELERAGAPSLLLGPPIIHVPLAALLPWHAHRGVASCPRVTPPTLLERTERGQARQRRTSRCWTGTPLGRTRQGLRRSLLATPGSCGTAIMSWTPMQHPLPPRILRNCSTKRTIGSAKISCCCLESRWKAATGAREARRVAWMQRAAFPTAIHARDCTVLRSTRGQAFSGPLPTRRPPRSGRWPVACRAGEDADRRGEASGPLATLPGARTVTAAESSGTEERSAVEKFFFPDKEELPGDFQMPIWDHLEELRERVIVAALACGAAILTCFCFSKDLVVFLEAPVMEKGVRFLQLSPGEFFFTTIKVAGYAGLLLSVPTVLYEIIAYVVPGLTRDERKFLGPVVLGSTFLFILGLFFSYQVLAPAALNFFISFADGAVESLWSIDQYFDFVLLLMLSTGLSFQVPVIQLMLGQLRIVTADQMFSQWRFVVVGATIAAAVLTPSTDPFTQSLLAAPLIGLYMGGAAAVKAIEQARGSA